MKFCCHCGDLLARHIPAGDNRPRHICRGCNSVHYENPKLLVGTVAYRGDAVLLCRRAFAPAQNLWTLPAGFMENDETSSEGAVRETWEEAGAIVEDDLQLYRMYDIPHMNQIYLFYLARLRGGRVQPGAEMLEAALFSEADIPWKHLAFSNLKPLLRDFFHDLHQRQFTFKACCEFQSEQAFGAHAASVAQQQAQNSSTHLSVPSRVAINGVT